MSGVRSSAALSEEEHNLYDRQIRLWGLESQKRLRMVNILVAGLNGLGAEVAKNLILAGVKSVTLMDHKTVTSNDFSSSFMIRRTDLDKNRAEASLEYARNLNPMVSVLSNTEDIQSKIEDTEFFEQFDIVCLTDCYPNNILTGLNDICRAGGVKFICGQVWGIHGYFFSDFIEHEYTKDIPPPPKKDDKAGGDGPQPKKPKLQEKESVLVKKTMRFVPLSKALQVKSGKAGVGINNKTSPVLFLVHVLLRFQSREGRVPRDDDVETLEKIKTEVAADLDVNEDKIQSEFFTQIDGQMSPAAAVVGGILAQEVIKVASCKDAPLKNMFLFDGDQCCGMVEAIGC